MAASMLAQGAGVAGIYNVAIEPEVIRRGYGSAMTLAALHAVCSLGCRVGILQSSELGYPMYLKLGFQERCRSGMYVWAEGKMG